MLNLEDQTEGSDLPTDTLPRPDSSTSGIAVGRVRWYSIAFLVVMATCLAEFLTGSTPFLGPVINPLGFAFNLGLYGGGALLIREAAVRWGKRWGAILLLGGSVCRGRGRLRSQDDGRPDFADHRDPALQSRGGGQLAPTRRPHGLPFCVQHGRPTPPCGIDLPGDERPQAAGPDGDSRHRRRLRDHGASSLPLLRRPLRPAS